jgi:hypothetical protein
MRDGRVMNLLRWNGEMIRHAKNRDCARYAFLNQTETGVCDASTTAASATLFRTAQERGKNLTCL